MNTTPADVKHAFSDEERRGVYRAIDERRDMRHFSGGVVADDVLRRRLRAAHHAPSVCFMQPWRFIRIRAPELCLGPVDEFYAQPMLQTERWASRAPLADMLFEDAWGRAPDVTQDGDV